MDSIYLEKNISPAKQQKQPAAKQSGIALLKAPIIKIFLENDSPSLQNGSFPLQKIYNRAVKRSFDFVFSSILIVVLLSWAIPLLALLIKLDSRGPIFFRQKRNRKAGASFRCIKFRTMIVNEEADIQAARKNDHRITKVGDFLRHYHLDELPQLFNVWMGQMSIIGPRPYMVNENLYYETLVDSYAQRHMIKPGITGLAQSYGYFGSFHDLDIVKERVQLDIEYIQQWSLSMDIKILFRTAMMVFSSRPIKDESNLPA